jgi:hypothetical protein
MNGFTCVSQQGMSAEGLEETQGVLPGHYKCELGLALSIDGYLLPACLSFVPFGRIFMPIGVRL